MADHGPPLRTERVASTGGRRAALGATLIAALTLLAVLKPWSAGDHATVLAGPVSPAASTRAALPAATAAPDPTIDPLVMRKQCRNPDVWRLVTLERSGQLAGRSLLPVTLVSASGPSDPRIVPQSLHTGALLALGYCVPTAIHPNVAAAEGAVLIWQAVAGLPLVPLSGERLADAGLASVGEVYLEPSVDAHGENATVSAAWPEGRYVFETPADTVGGAPGWFAFTFSSTAIVSVAAP